MANPYHSVFCELGDRLVVGSDIKMDEIASVIAKQKIARAMSKPDEYECFVDGQTIGMGQHPVPCLLSSVSGATAKVVIADGQDTGVEINVPLSSVAVVGGAKMADVARKLFRGQQP